MEQRQSNIAKFSVPNVSLLIQLKPSVNYFHHELNPNKVSNIISSWHLKLSGNENKGLMIDSFLYRVQALAMQSLRRNFEVLCLHLRLLFVGKGLDWYWFLEWEYLCSELRVQFKARQSNLDIRE